jgi:DNA-binding MarR family transcriptional regulator
MDQDIAAMARTFRRFNRVYMSKLRPLRDVMRGPSMHVSYLRVIRELGEAPSGTTATNIAGALGMDPGLVCRILGWYRAQRYLQESVDPADRRRKIVSLNALGRRSYKDHEALVKETAEFMLRLVSPGDRAQLIAAMKTIEQILRHVRWHDVRPPPL